MNIKKRRGPSTVPLGTPEISGMFDVYYHTLNSVSKKRWNPGMNFTPYSMPVKLKEAYSEEWYQKTLAKIK